MISWILGAKVKLMAYVAMGLAFLAFILKIYTKGRKDAKIERALKDLDDYSNKVEQIQENKVKDEDYENALRSGDVRANVVNKLSDNKEFRD